MLFFLFLVPATERLESMLQYAHSEVLVITSVDVPGAA